jgi:Ca2+-binding RTX toxin-like protein
MVDIRVNYDHFFIGDLADAWHSSSVVTAPTATHFEMADSLTGRKVAVTGSNFQGGAIGTTPTLGVVNAITYYNHDGSLAWSITGLHVALADFEKAIGTSSFTSTATIEAFFAQTGFSTGQGLNFYGGIGGDTINGGYGEDVIRGGLGADVISGGFGHDRLYGGGQPATTPAEMDTLTYANEVGGSPITVNVQKGRVTDTYGFVDRISGFEIIVGTSGADTFIAGNSKAFHGFVGGAGDDIFQGGAGSADAVFYDRLNTAGINITVSATGLLATGTSIGSDALTNIDIIVGSVANDTVYGSNADEHITGGNGIDTLDGGGGRDTLDFSYETGAYGAVVNLSSGVDIDTYHSGLGSSSAYVEHATNFDNVVGSANADFITGSSAANRLDGGAGDDEIRGQGGKDVISGGGGNDWIVGGANIDRLSGGGGSDVFVFAHDDTGKTSATADTISDFSANQGDIIDLSPIDANDKKGGNQVFHFVADHAFHHAAGELRFAIVKGDTFVYGDTNGDGKADFEIHLSGVVKLDAGDFNF